MIVVTLNEIKKKEKFEEIHFFFVELLSYAVRKLRMRIRVEYKTIRPSNSNYDDTIKRKMEL